ncbi:TetR/AcrR family transcriptional regulator [Herpetosiphon giganteus]|uniref:TetR/AcrR family transcriptional regulator n=1 Tax=Herpetosiphon giganteus TaxID=2029754 RepID=UPI00195EAD93|nr:TetR/AcrR family transcriptional regulator [Herpetosiphon giganteus]MBM7844646.1 AcrR family transcriptional regulator [Herpetosiphon giganteus]
MENAEITHNLNSHDRIVRVTAHLLANGGLESVSTRAVAEAAGVQVPIIYRLFGDMRGLLNAVVSHGFEVYLESKRERLAQHDPVEEIRHGWDMHVEFGLLNPALYRLMYGEPQPSKEVPAAIKAFAILRERVTQIAATGRLLVDVESAAQMLHAACRGVTFSLLESDSAKRDLALSNRVREAILTAITRTVEPTLAEQPNQLSHMISMAVALKALLPNAHMLTSGERALLTEWLDRLSMSR